MFFVSFFDIFKTKIDKWRKKLLNREKKTTKLTQLTNRNENPET